MFPEFIFIYKGLFLTVHIVKRGEADLEILQRAISAGKEKSYYFIFDDLFCCCL